MNAMDMLEKTGFRPLEAGNVGGEALLFEYADEITPPFTAVDMSGSRDGVDLANLTSERWPDIGILIVSGHADAKSRMPQGGIFPGKPFSADVVYDRLQELLPDGKKLDSLKQ